MCEAQGVNPNPTCRKFFFSTQRENQQELLREFREFTTDGVHNVQLVESELLTLPCCTCTSWPFGSALEKNGYRR